MSSDQNKLAKPGANSGPRGLAPELRQDKLQTRVRDILLREIARGSFPSGRLPAENKLAQMLGVSRATISITLAFMEREGIVLRRHGSATYVNLGYAQVKVLINRGLCVYDSITAGGFKPALLKDELTRLPAAALEEAVRQKLALSGGDICLLRRVFSADGAPAAYVEEYIPADKLSRPLEGAELPESIYRLSEQFLVAPIEFTIADIIPCLGPPEVRALLSCAPDEALLGNEELHSYNKSRPLMFSKLYLRDRYIRFQVIRIRE